MKLRYPYFSLREDARRAMLAATLASLLLPARADYQAEVASEDPLVYYRFNDSVATDDSPVAVNTGSAGTAANGAYQANFTRGVAGAIAGNSAVAFVNNAAVDTAAFTGSVSIYNTAGLNPSHTGTNPFTVECWVLPSRNTSTLLSPINSMSFTTGRAGYLIYQNAATWEMRMGNKAAANNVTAVTGGTVTPGQWQHLVLSYSGGTNGTMTLYVNGVQAASSAVTNGYEANDNAPFVIGATSAPSRTFDGSVDEVAFFPSLLSPARIQARFNERTNNPAGYSAHVLADAPVGYWRLDEPAFVPRASPVADNLGTLGNSADGSYVGGSKNVLTGPAPSSGFDGFGANNSCVSLATANGNITSNQALLNNRSSFTVMGWVKRGAIHSSRGGYFGQNDLLEFGDAGGGTQIEAWSSASGQVLTDAPYPFADGEWGFIAYTADGTKVRLFINGVETKSVDSTVASYGSSLFNFNIGGGGIFNNTGDYFLGEIDEVAIFDHAVTPGRIKQLYDTALGDVGPGLVDTFPALTPEGTIAEGESYTLSIDPTGTPPFTYQWKLNGVDIPGANSPTYTVSSAVASGTLGYSVLVSNNAPGSVLSDTTEVPVTPALKWTGTDPDSPTVWNTSEQNWQAFTGGTPTLYGDEFAVRFDDSATSTAVTVPLDVTPQMIFFTNVNKNYSLSGAGIIAGPSTAVLSKEGAGIVELANDFVVVENVVVKEGILRVGNGANGALSAITTVRVEGGELQINQAPGANYDTFLTDVGVGTSLSVMGTGDLTISGRIEGAGDEVFNRNGTVVVAANNAIGGNVTIASGIVAFDGAQEANRLPVNKLVTVNPGATMEVRGVNAFPTALNSVDVSLSSATLNVVSGGSTAIPGGTSHAHLRNLLLNASLVNLNYSGGGGAYNGESFQLNGDITVAGTTSSTIGFGSGANAGNAGVAIRAATTPVVHTFNVPDVAAGATADLIIAAELENSDSATADILLSSVVKSGAGTLRLAGNIDHSYLGTLQVSQGTLEATGSIAGPLSLAAGTGIRPGDPVGTFGAGATVLGGTFHCQIDGAVADAIEVTGDLTIQPGAQISISILGGAPTAPAYVLCSCTGTLTGSLPTASGVPAGYTLGISSGSIVLTQAGLNPQPTIALTSPPVNGIVDFNSNGGGFSASAPVSAETDWTYTSGSWRSSGQATGGLSGDNTSHLLSPIYTLTQAGPVTLSFTHRYSFEEAFDAGAVQVSMNGGAFALVPASAFSQNPYNATVPADVTHSLKELTAFMGNSPGHPAFITSVCTVATGAVGDRVQVRFTAAYDDNTIGDLTPPGWEIDSLQLTGGVPNLLTLEWPLGIMQYSDNLEPPWTDLPGTSPLVIDVKAAPKRFFRLKP